MQQIGSTGKVAQVLSIINPEITHHQAQPEASHPCETGSKVPVPEHQLYCLKVQHESFPPGLGPRKYCSSHPFITRFNSVCVYSQPRNAIHGAYNPSVLHSSGPKAHTTSPIVTGTSVLAVKFKDGVVIAADNLGAHMSPTGQVVKADQYDLQHRTDP